MLKDETNGELDKIKAFAKKINKTVQLQQELDYLADYGQQETRCVLFHDFAPQSLTFVMQQRNKENNQWEYWFNGGLIFHGSHDDYGSGRAPTLSVCVSPTDGWSVHT